MTPFSSLLFLQIMEVLSRVLNKPEERGFICGFHVGLNSSIGVSVSLILFPYDTIMFCDASREHLFSIKMALICFAVVTGLMVMWGKVKLFLLER